MIDPVAKIEKSLKQLALQRANLRAQVEEQPDVAGHLKQALSQLDEAGSKLQALKPRAAELKKRQAVRAKRPPKSPRPPMKLPAGWPLSHERIQAAAQALVQRARPASAARPPAAVVPQGSDVHTMDSSHFQTVEQDHEEAPEDRRPLPPAKAPPPKPRRRVSDSSVTGWEIEEDPN